MHVSLLIIDSNVPRCDAVSEHFLEHRGAVSFSVSGAYTGSRGKQLLGVNSIDAIVVEHELSDLSGLHFAEEVRNNGYGGWIIVRTRGADIAFFPPHPRLRPLLYYGQENMFELVTLVGAAACGAVLDRGLLKRCGPNVR